MAVVSAESLRMDGVSAISRSRMRGRSRLAFELRTLRLVDRSVWLWAANEQDGVHRVVQPRVALIFRAVEFNDGDRRVPRIGRRRPGCSKEPGSAVAIRAEVDPTCNRTALVDP